MTVPQPLPQKSTITVGKRDKLLGGSYYEASIPPTGTAKYLSADYRLWIPDGVKTVRGLLVKQHGCGDPAAATGLEHANDLQLQALALKHQLALLGTKLPTGDQSCNNWAIIDYGSKDAFLKALHALAQKSRHPELDKVPWALWGHSGGADWAMQMLQKYSVRTIAVAVMRCGGVLISETSTFLTSDPDSAIFGVPVLFAEGEKEPTVDECLDLPKKIFSRYRRAGALWALAVEANAGHESADTRLLALPYLDAILTARLKAHDTKLRQMDAAQSWLGNTTTHKIAPMNQYEEDPLEAAWLPNEETARKWQEYVSTGEISPTRKPAAPTDVRATRIGAAEVVLTWNFTPDLENGLPSFRIYRDNSMLRTLQGQRHNFGDAPVPDPPDRVAKILQLLRGQRHNGDAPELPDVVLEFRDTGATTDATYTVSAFNVLGESVSQPTRLDLLGNSGK